MKATILIFSLLLSVSVLAQEKEEHPIDQWCLECLDQDSNWTTVGMIQCEAQALEKWQQEMDKFYQLLLDSLSEESATVLMKAQEAWLVYAEEEKHFSSQLYYNEMDGTMWRVISAGRISSIYRERALALKEYYDLYEFK